MRCTSITALHCVFALCLIASAPAQTVQPTPHDDAAKRQGALTGKERLGPKWTDEQRIDNCNVPPDKRGAKPRSSACPHAPPS
ncbi:hypothetical protein ACFFWD_11705 [Bradyrhizobium erythrophlei]|uniref:hypothetical protein n=1 Tax=Bradyrhizobium erythrophlei TaxID=1437360 RepID=UPI0035EEA2A2